jgi:integrase
MLSQDITRYVDLKRAMGFTFLVQNRLLRSFVGFAEARGDEFVRADRALDWAGCTTSPAQRRRRLLTVRRFALAMQAEDARHEVPAANAMGPEKRERPTPYIYAPSELVQLMDVAARLEPRGSIRPLMYSTLFGLLASTGLRISEALALRLEDVTEDGLIICETKFHKNRLVPLHNTTRRALSAYLWARTRLGTFSNSLFVSTSGTVPAYSTVLMVFQQLIRSIGLRGARGQRGPRIHDIRHTFAVRSLEKCRHDREAVSHHIFALSTYLGHAHVTDTYWYLQSTPLLMRQIADAGETLLREGVVP